MKGVVLIMFLFGVIQVNSQSNSDSLWSVWNTTSQPDTARLKALRGLIGGLINGQPDSAFQIAQIQYDFASEKGLGIIAGNALIMQGITLDMRGQFDSALEYYLKSLPIYKKNNHKQGIALAYNNIAGIYEGEGVYPLAIDYYMKSLKMATDLNSKRGISICLTNIAGLYSEMGDYDKALDYLKRGLEIKKEENYSLGIVNSKQLISSLYLEIGDYSSALIYANSSLKLSEEINYEMGVAHSYSSLGEISLNEEDYEKSEEFYFKSLKIYEKIEFTEGIVSVLINLGVINTKQSNYKKALEYSKKAFFLSEDLRLVEEKKAASYSLYEIYKANGSCNTALEMYEMYVLLSDSIDNEKNQRELLRQEYQYDYDKQIVADSTKNAELNKVNEALLMAEQAENKQQKQQTLFLYGVLALSVLFGGFIFSRFKVTKSQKSIIENQKEQVDLAFSQLEIKNNEILDSINYAKRIQSAILPSDKEVKKCLPNSFVFYKPKDIVAGDFYWLECKDGKVLFAAADCTGHGVPGAMVSVVCNNGLNRSVREHGLTSPSEILDKTREIVLQEFEKSEEEVKDGMDIALCSLRTLRVPQGAKEETVALLEYAGAHNPLWIIRKGEIIETKANKQPIGKFENSKPFTNHTFELQKNDTIYIFSDGFVDQFGGEKGKKFKTKAFKELLLSIQEKTMEEQLLLIDDVFENWKGELEQIDDICIIGVKI